MRTYSERKSLRGPTTAGVPASSRAMMSSQTLRKQPPGARCVHDIFSQYKLYLDLFSILYAERCLVYILTRRGQSVLEFSSPSSFPHPHLPRCPSKNRVLSSPLTHFTLLHAPEVRLPSRTLCPDRSPRETNCSSSPSPLSHPSRTKPLQSNTKYYMSL